MDNQAIQAERRQDITTDEDDSSQFGTYVMSYGGVEYNVSKIADNSITKDDNTYSLLSSQKVLNFKDVINTFNSEEFKIRANIFSKEISGHNKNKKDKVFNLVTDNDLIGDQNSKNEYLNLVNYLIWELDNLSVLSSRLRSKKCYIKKMSDYETIYVKMLLNKYDIKISEENIIHKINNVVKKIIGFITIFLKKNSQINKIHINNVNDSLLREENCCNYSSKKGYKTPNGSNINFCQFESVGMARGSVRLSPSFGL